MVLSDDILTRDGRRLLVKGQILSDKELRVLKIWGVSEASVETGNAFDKPDVPTSPESFQKFKSHLETRFRKNNISIPVIETVFSLCLLRMGALPVKDSCFSLKTSGLTEQNLPDQTSINAIRPVDNIQVLFKENIKLPALPTIYTEINDAIQNPNCSGKDIADIVSKDTSLSARLLKIINSAYYGLSRKVESLTYAAVALGTTQISTLAIGITVIDYFKGIPNQTISMQSFWKHSVACAICSRILASHIKGTNPDRLFIGGLLHDIGRLLLLSYFPEEYSWVIQTSRSKDCSIFKTEPEIFSLTHAELGSLIAGSWNFSENITNMIHCHHDIFSEAPNPEIAIIHFSDWLVHALEIGSSGEFSVPELSMPAWQSLALSESVLETIIKQIDRQVAEAISFFYE